MPIISGSLVSFVFFFELGGRRRKNSFVPIDWNPYFVKAHGPKIISLVRFDDTRRPSSELRHWGGQPKGGGEPEPERHFTRTE